MSRLALLFGMSLLVVACSGAPAATTSAPATVAPTSAPTLVPPTVGIPTLAPPIATPAITAPAISTDAPSAPPASGETGSVGEKVEVSGYQYLTLVESEYTTEGYSDFFKPDAGNVIYAFLFEFEGLDADGSSYNPLYFDLTVDGTRFSTAFLGGKEPTLSSGELQPGATASGWISFNAPLADRVTLKYEPVLGFAGNAVEWNVTVVQ